MKAQGSYSRRRLPRNRVQGGSVTNERNSSGPRIASVTSPELLAVLEELKLREPIFHHPEFGTTRWDYEAMTDPEFWEVGASGRRYSREFVLETLENRAPDPDEAQVADARFPMPGDRRGQLPDHLHSASGKARHSPRHALAPDAERLEDSVSPRHHRRAADRNRTRHYSC